MIEYVEKPPHADRERIRHVTEAGLVAALVKSLEGVLHGAGRPEGVLPGTGPGADVDALLAHRARAGRRPVPTPADRVAAYGP
ncbi:hypothetical protein, partial [Actinophytocola sp.]|uniref:hypothetical protein n=1 Tax=Actinophytocola sp. TaxID=1872138 RepID=UPI003D6A39FD